MAPTHPLQPLVRDAGGVVRFRENAIVSAMLDAEERIPGGLDLNRIASRAMGRASPPVAADDRAQLAQLIGYSVSGAADLSSFPDAHWGLANAASKILSDAPTTELPPHPHQPLTRNKHGEPCFHANALVIELYTRAAKRGENYLRPSAPCSDADRAQLAQLCGCPVAVYMAMTYVTDAQRREVQAMLDAFTSSSPARTAC